MLRKCFLSGKSVAKICEKRFRTTFIFWLQLLYCSFNEGCMNFFQRLHTFFTFLTTYSLHESKLLVGLTYMNNLNGSNFRENPGFVFLIVWPG